MQNLQNIIMLLSDTPFLKTVPGMIIVQGIGFIAMGFGILSFQAKKRNTIVAMQMTSAIFWTTQMALLGKPAGALLNSLNLTRNFVYLFKKKNKFLSSKLIPSIFIVIAILISIFSYKYEGWLVLFPLTALIIQTIVFFGDNPKMIRIMSYVVSPTWLIYDALIGSIAGVCCEIFTITSITIALIRYKKKGKMEEEPQDNTK